MKHLIEFADQVLLCHEVDLPALPCWFTVSRRRAILGSVTAWDVAEAAGDLAALRTERPTYFLDRYLDHFHLWTPQDDAARRQVVLDMLFDSTASDYEHLVNVQQN